MKKIDEQRYLWILRAIGVFAALSIFLNIILLAAFYKVAPSEKIEAFLIEADDADKRIIYVAPASLSTKAGTIGNTIAANYIAKYAIDRESQYADRAKTMALVGPDSDVALMSEPAMYQQFLNSPEYAEKISNPQRKIIVASIDPEKVLYMSRNDYWDVTVDTTSMDANGLNHSKGRKKLRITARFATADMKKSGGTAFRNPLGFTVTKYEYDKTAE
ncbi:MAG: type IV secretion system protein [Rickettsiales bacterium]|nr:type IV secretion system protein [Rickettsiales bacterium]